MKLIRTLAPCPLLFCLTVILAGSSSTVAAPAIRIRERFDANWQFRTDPVVKHVGASIAWQWQPATSVELKTATVPVGLPNIWRPARDQQDVFLKRNGYAWFRTDLGKGSQPKNLYLHFEGVDDSAAVFMNGRRLIVHEGWNEPFEAHVGEVWNPDGPNIVYMLVQNTAAAGGLNGPVWLDVRRPDVAPLESVPGYNDATWRTVHLPHDYGIEGKFDPKADTSHGSLPIPTAWYRKHFTLTKAYAGKSVWIDFDGVYRDATIYLNGRKLGRWPSGYASFRYDITGIAKVGRPNLLAVRVDPTHGEGWWYEGAGIYRHVWLNAADKVHVAPWGVYAMATVKGPESQTSPAAEVSISTQVANDLPTSESCNITSTVIDPAGSPRALTTTTIDVPPHASRMLMQSAVITKSQLWSIETPRLYRVITTIRRRGAILDSTETHFGIRTLRFDPNFGFFLNGKSVKLQGTCNHQDHAGVGIALTDGLIDWRIKKLKEMGSNAYRCSHNPPAAELLDACDRLGMVVMDETRHLGSTSLSKSPSGTKFDDKAELQSLILRDRNHPSVIMWSLFNEEGLQATKEGAAIFEKEAKFVKSLDPSRPCTGATNWGYGEGITFVEDMQGMNYGIGAYDRIHNAFPNLPMFGSETASTVSTRGIYANDTKAGYVSAYDVNKPDWGATAEEGWKALADRPWMAGGFVWTGFDYKGEPTPYGWPCINSHFGIIDICGFPKDNFFYYQAWWGSKPMVHLLPHWNWPAKKGVAIPVWAYSNGDEIELILNGSSLGRQKMPAHEHVAWQVPYSPGTLLAKAYRNGKLIVTDKVVTTGAPAALRVTSTQPVIPADGEEFSLVEVAVVDAAGNVVQDASNLVSFSTTGVGNVVGVGNGDPSSHEPDVATSRRAFNGRCMVLIGRASQPGTINLTVSARGLKSANLVVDAKAHLKGDR